MPQRNSVFSKSGFTLIELIVVIAILAILSAIAIPSLRGIRTNALRTESLSNLRQLYAAFTLYAQDNNGRLPNSWVAPSEEFGRTTTDWRSQLVSSGFLGERTEAAAGGQSAYSVLGSPIQRREAAEFTINRNPPRMATYGMNGRLNQLGAFQESIHFTFLNFINPSRTLLLSSGRSSDQQWFNVSVNPWIIPNFTDDYIEVLYADGRAAVLPLSEFPNNSVPRDPGSDAWYFWEAIE